MDQKNTSPTGLQPVHQSAFKINVISNTIHFSAIITDPLRMISIEGRDRSQSTSLNPSNQTLNDPDRQESSSSFEMLTNDIDNPRSALTNDRGSRESPIDIDDPRSVLSNDRGSRESPIDIDNPRSALTNDRASTESPSNRTNEESTLNDEPQTHLTNPPRLKSLLRTNKFTLMVAIVAGCLLILSSIYAWALSLTTGPLTRIIPPNPWDLTILRIFSELAKIFLGFSWNSALEVVLWAASGSKRGITMTSLLAISPTTKPVGLFRLLLWNGSHRNHLFWTAIKYSPLLCFMIF